MGGGTAAVLVMESLGLGANGHSVYFMSVEQARFRKPITPGDCVHLHVERQHRRGDVWKFRGEAKVNGTLVAEATYTAMISR